MKHKSINAGMAVAFGAAIGAALGAATGHMAGWVAIGVVTGAVIGLMARGSSGLNCGPSNEKINPPTDNH